MSSEKEPVAWLRRQVETRLALARDAGGGQWHTGCECKGACREWLRCTRVEGEDITIYGEGGHDAGQAVYIAANDPRDTIARCEAELAILEAHNQAEHYCPIPVLPGRHGQLWTPEEGPCWTLRLLASGYRHHAGYADHWGERIRVWQSLPVPELQQPAQGP